MNQEQGEFYMALNGRLDDINNNIRDVDKRQREDIKALEVVTASRHEEVRDKLQVVQKDMGEMKSRLTVIEAQTATKERAKKVTWERVLLILTALASAGAWFHK